MSRIGPTGNLVSQMDRLERRGTQKREAEEAEEQAHLPVSKMTCMVSKLSLSSEMVVASQTLLKASAQVNLLPSFVCQQCTTH